MRRRVAYHEAGHVVAAWAEGVPIRQATITPNKHEGYLGAVLNRRLDIRSRPAVATDYTAARRLLEPRIVVSLAGVIAERLVSKRHNWIGSADDRHEATESATSCVMSQRELDPYLAWLWKRAEFKIEFHRAQVDAIAAALLTAATLTGAELRTVLAVGVETA